MEEGSSRQQSKERVAAAAAGGAALPQRLRLWSWGSGSHGQLGLGDTEDHSLPQLVPLLDPVNAELPHPINEEEEEERAAGWKLVVAGTSHSLGLTTGTSLTLFACFASSLSNKLTRKRPTGMGVGLL